MLQTAMIVLLTLLFAEPAYAKGLLGCMSRSPNEIVSIDPKHADKEQFLIETGRDAVRAMGLIDRVTVSFKFFGCTADGRVIETVMVDPRTGNTPVDVASLNKADVSIPYYVLRVSIDLLMRDRATIEWSVTHAICHIRQGTVKHSESREEQDLEEEYAERCVTEVVGEVSHAAAYANTPALFRAGDKGLRERYGLALGAILERVTEYPDPW